MTLGYRHGFHAGNAADVFKHSVLAHAMSAFVRASGTRAVHYVDTHSGAGRYDLTHEFARKVGRWRHGVGRLWGRSDYPDAMSAYVQALLTCNNATHFRALHAGPRYYPGSPYVVNALRRVALGDTMRLHDLHSTEVELLRHAFGAQRGVTVQHTDGFDVLNDTQLPPKGDAAARGIVLLDPAYELASDYTRVMDAFERGVTAWRHNSLFAVWYPLLSAPAKRAAFDAMVQRWHTQTARVVAAPPTTSAAASSAARAGAGAGVGTGGGRAAAAAATAAFTPGALYRIELATYRAPPGTPVPAGARTDAYGGFKAAAAAPDGAVVSSASTAATAVDAGAPPSADRSSDGTPGIYGSGLLIATPAHSSSSSTTAASASGHAAFWPRADIVERQWTDIAQYCWTLMASERATPRRAGRNAAAGGGDASSAAAAASVPVRDGYFLVQRISGPPTVAAAGGAATRAV